MKTLAGGRPALRPPPSLADLRSRRAEILAVCAASGASDVRVFGSVARGTAAEGSDLGLLVDLEPGRSLFDLGRVLTELETLLGCPVDVMTAVRPRIRDRAQAEALPL